jgi:hypothetical protein
MPANELTHERPADEHPDQRDEKNSRVAQRLNPALHEVLTQRECQHGQSQKRCDCTDFECAPRRLSHPPDREGQQRHRERHQHRGRERNVADKHPIDDPRRKAQQNAHEGSV